MEPRAFLRALFDAAVAAADPAVVLPAHLPEPPRGRTIVVGAGKASAAMGLALERHWPGELTGLIVTRYGHGAPCERIEVVEAAHPVPDEAGSAAAARILDLVGGLSEDDLVLALISGGGSALLTLPPDGLSLADKQGINRALLRSGASIDEMNCVRKHLSRIKGGGGDFVDARHDLVRRFRAAADHRDLMAVTGGRQPGVASPAVSMNCRPRLHGVLQEGQQALGGDVLDAPKADAPRCRARAVRPPPRRCPCSRPHGPACLPPGRPHKVSSASISPARRSRPGRTMARRSLCSQVQEVS